MTVQRSTRTTRMVKAGTIAMLPIVAAWHADAGSCSGDGETRFLAVSWDGDVFCLDASGGGGLLGPTNYSQLNSMARDSSGTLVAGRQGQQLIRLYPQTGGGIPHGSTCLIDVRALAYSPDDLLYAMREVGGAFSDLYVVPRSCSPRLIDRCTIPHVLAMDFDSDGTLYGWAHHAGLVVIDPETAEATDVNGIDDGNNEIQSITFADDGTLYGARDALFMIDVTTGAVTRVGTGDYSDIRGIEWFVSGCAGDIDANGTVDVDDLTDLLLAWGDSSSPADLDGNGTVDVDDLLGLLLAWGPCRLR